MQGEHELIIQWENLPTYNTIMSLAAGAVLLSLSKMMKNLRNNTKINPRGLALNLGVLGLILFTTGLHMTLTWPLAPDFPFDNIVFGEPSLALGSISLAMSFYFWSQHNPLEADDQPLVTISQTMRHFKYILYGIGLALIAIGFAGVTFQLFAAPPQEPITGLLADYPMVEAVFISLLWALTGVAALLMPSVLDDFSQSRLKETTKVKATLTLMKGTGWVFLLFGAINYFTHIGLVVNTMPK